MEMGAIFSPCRTYRYRLWRVWDANLPALNVIGLNPSTADETADDNTIRRCTGFARQWGCGSLQMTNLFAYRATLPAVMKAAPDPVGPDNNVHLIDVADRALIVLPAWGVHGTHAGRAEAVWQLLSPGVEMHCLGRTKDGHPKHPLYLAKTTRPEPFTHGPGAARGA